MSLRHRVLLEFLLVAVALVVTNVALASAFEDDLVRRIDQELVDTANRPISRTAEPGHSGPGGLASSNRSAISTSPSPTPRGPG